MGKGQTLSVGLIEWEGSIGMELIEETSCQRSRVKSLRNESI